MTSCGSATTSDASSPMTDADDGVTQVLPALAGFGRELRAAGLPVGTGQVLSFCEGLARLDPTDLRDIYWTGRACLVSRHDDLSAYDNAFAHYFLGDAGPRHLVPSDGSPPVDANQARPDALAPATGSERRSDAESVGQSASDVELLRDKDFADCDPDELAAIGRLMAGLVIAAPEAEDTAHRAGQEGRPSGLTARVAHACPPRRRRPPDPASASAGARASARPPPGRLGLDVLLFACAAPVRVRGRRGGRAGSRSSASGRA